MDFFHVWCLLGVQKGQVLEHFRFWNFRLDIFNFYLFHFLHINNIFWPHWLVLSIIIIMFVWLDCVHVCLQMCGYMVFKDAYVRVENRSWHLVSSIFHYHSLLFIYSYSISYWSWNESVLANQACLRNPVSGSQMLRLQVVITTALFLQVFWGIEVCSWCLLLMFVGKNFIHWVISPAPSNIMFSL